MAFKNYREESRNGNWGSDQNPNLNMDEINCGSMLRIADSMEIMSKNYVQLQNDCEKYKKYYKEERECNERLVSRIKSLKGWITRLKNKSR